MILDFFRQDAVVFTKFCKPTVPFKPTPYSFYHESRREELLERGLTNYETKKTCTQDYRMLKSEEKLKWILLAVEKVPAYLVSYYYFTKN